MLRANWDTYIRYSYLREMGNIENDEIAKTDRKQK